MRTVKVIEAMDRETFENQLNEFIKQTHLLLFNVSTCYDNGKYIAVIFYEKVLVTRKKSNSNCAEFCVACGNRLPTESGRQYCKECEAKYL